MLVSRTQSLRRTACKLVILILAAYYLYKIRLPACLPRTQCHAHGELRIRSTLATNVVISLAWLAGWKLHLTYYVSKAVV